MKIRELEKASKVLSKLKGNEILFKDEAEGRHLIAYYAMEGEVDALQALMADFSQDSEAERHFARSLNNLSCIAHQASLRFCSVLWQGLAPSLPPALRVDKLLHLLELVSEHFRGDLGFLESETVAYLEARELPAERHFELWQALCAVLFRSNCNNTALVNALPRLAACELPQNLVQAVLKKAFSNEQSWDKQLSQVYWLLNNGQVKMAEVKAFIDKAYRDFPLEALAALESFAWANEYLASLTWEEEALERHLNDKRAELKILQKASREALESALFQVFAEQSHWPEDKPSFLDKLQSLGSHQHPYWASLGNDERRAILLQRARKLKALRSLAVAFLKYFNPNNPYAQAYSVDLLMALQADEERHALALEQWLSALKTHQGEALKAQAALWLKRLGACEP